ncbi:TPA: tail assembly protein, partial [Mannheimia haemolytica]|nr:tail assembly protein [Mannheimia haemolytica]
MITVKFYGHLRKFGTDFRLEVKDTAEAIRALCSQLTGLRETLRDG